MVAAMCLVMSSCLKNDTPDYVAPVDPAAEVPALQAFIDSTGYNLATQSSDYSYYSFDNASQSFKLATVSAPYLYYEIVTPGNLTQGHVDTSDAAIGGSIGGTTAIYNTYTDSTLYASVTYVGTLLDGTVFDKQDKPVLLPVPNLVAAWYLSMNKVGKGGEIRILAPSAYGYSNVAKQGIPANSPLYFDIKIVGFVKTTYGK